MKDVSLKELLEAGCHFGHKVSRWHPKADTFIYQSREGIHIIDLAKTKAGLVEAAHYVKKLAEDGKILLVIATKRQAKGIVSDAAKRAGLPYLTNRWVGGFMTNWEEVKKNIEKVLKMRDDRTNGAWKKFPKHEQVKLEKDLRKLEMVYAGVTELLKLPDAVFIIDIKTEHIALNESQRKEIPVVAIVDTNSDPNSVDYAIPANDDAVGSLTFLTNHIMDAFIEGREIREKEEGKIREAEAKKAATGQAEVKKIGNLPDKAKMITLPVKEEKVPAPAPAPAKASEGKKAMAGEERAKKKKVEKVVKVEKAEKIKKAEKPVRKAKK